MKENENETQITDLKGRVHIKYKLVLKCAKLCSNYCAVNHFCQILMFVLPGANRRKY